MGCRHQNVEEDRLDFPAFQLQHCSDSVGDCGLLEYVPCRARETGPSDRSLSTPPQEVLSLWQNEHVAFPDHFTVNRCKTQSLWDREAEFPCAKSQNHRGLAFSPCYLPSAQPQHHRAASQPASARRARGCSVRCLFLLLPPVCPPQPQPQSKGILRHWQIRCWQVEHRCIWYRGRWTEAQHDLRLPPPLPASPRHRRCITIHSSLPEFIH